MRSGIQRARRAWWIVPVGVLAALAMAPRVQAEEQEWRYQPSQVNHPVPKFEYTDDGQAIMLKRYPANTAKENNLFRLYSFYENKHGVEHYCKGSKLKREYSDILSEEQKKILATWGQPDYLRGPYKSTRGDSVIEWAYHASNHLFQFVDRKMVYEGPLSDQERVAITYGAPREVIVVQLEPNIRRETWIYRPIFRSVIGNEKLFSFSNGKLTYQQETP
jgi:hypothetical protein